MAAKVIHVEVVGKDGAALQRFYGDVFDWSLSEDDMGALDGLSKGPSAGVDSDVDGH